MIEKVRAARAEAAALEGESSASRAEAKHTYHLALEKRYAWIAGERLDVISRQAAVKFARDQRLIG